MKKQLSEMSLDELWELFPIVLKEHDPQYKAWYEDERQRVLCTVAPEEVVRINHIGSTAVEGLVAKPTVDILLEVGQCCELARLTEDLEADGWLLMSEERDPLSLSFNKGYTPEGFGEKVYHLHVRHAGDWDELYFRDFLIAHPDVAAEYGALKLRLWKDFEHDRDGYTEAKKDFVAECSAAAKEEFPGRYKSSRSDQPERTT